MLVLTIRVGVTTPRRLAETQRDAVDATFARFLARGDVGIILINQPIADMIRCVVLAPQCGSVTAPSSPPAAAPPHSCSASIAAHTAAVPMVLEIPSKDVAYEPTKDPIMKRVLQMLGEAP